MAAKMQVIWVSVLEQDDHERADRSSPLCKQYAETPGSNNDTKHHVQKNGFLFYATTFFGDRTFKYQTALFATNS